LVLEVSADIDVVVDNGSPKRRAFVAGRGGGLVQTESHGGVQIRGNVVVEGNRTREDLLKNFSHEKVTQ